MLSDEKYVSFNLELQQRLENEIIRVQQGESSKDINQLNNILKELKSMITSKGLTLAFPRIIVDSWDYTDELGLDLIRLSEMYSRMGK